MAGTKDGSLLSFSISKINEKNLSNSNWDILIPPQKANVIAITENTGYSTYANSSDFFVNKLTYVGLSNGEIYSCNLKDLVINTQTINKIAQKLIGDNCNNYNSNQQQQMEDGVKNAFEVLPTELYTKVNELSKDDAFDLSCFPYSVYK